MTPVDPGTPAVVKRGWMPTRKWIAAQVVALAGVAVSAIDSGWDDTEWKLLIGIAVQAATTYLLSNGNEPGGVPDARVESWRPKMPYGK